MALPALRYFNPDPLIPDSDVLGYGDLIYDDGSKKYLSGDSELIAGLSQQPMGPPPPVDIGDGFQVDQMGNILKDGAPALDMTGVQDPNTGELLDPGQPSAFLPALGGEIANAARGYPEPIGTAWEQQMGPTQAPAQPEQPSGITVQADDGTPYTITQQGDIAPGAGGIPFEQAAQTTPKLNLVPYERQGALPEDVASRQLSAMEAQQKTELGAFQQARADEARMVNELTLQQMAANEAQRVKEEEMIAEQQAKVERWQAEQQQVVNMEIESDLLSAAGPVGAILMVAGATLLGANGSDAGLRMIDGKIDRFVRNQVNQRDARLGLLAKQIGSSQQAIALGKAQLYKVTADRMEILAQKTKNDVYEAQTPAMVEQLRTKQLASLQQAEQLSMGKLIERAPAPPKPPNEAMLQKYGELRRERDASTGVAQRAEQQLGLVWTPGKNGQPGYYANKDEVLKNGIQGVGNLEQWVPDFVYSTLGGMTEEGYQVRGTAEAMAYAQIRQMQPTGPISNADIQAAVKAGALNTEEGLIRGLERIRTNAEAQLDHDVRQYGPDVVGTYEARGSGPTALATPAASRPASLAEMRAGSAALRQGGKPGKVTESAAAQLPPEQRMAQVSEDLQAMGTEAGLPPEGIAILLSQAAHESRNGDSQGAAAGNMFGHKRTGSRPGIVANTTEGEGADAKRVRAEFALYPTIADGVADHLSLLQRRYPRAWEALQTGDVDQYVAALKDGHYFTGNESAYLKAVLRGL